MQFHIGLWNRRGLDRPVPLKPILQEVQIDINALFRVCNLASIALHHLPPHLSKRSQPLIVSYVRRP